MRTTKMLVMLIFCLGLIASFAGVAVAAPMGTAFTYQGRLIDANNAADGLYDFQFKLYDANVTETQKGGILNIGEVDVIDGYFTTELDFSNVFDGNDRWLQIGVRAGELNDPNVYTILEPRQKITATPYALYAASTPGGSGVPVPLILSGSFSQAIIDANNTGSGYGVYGKNTTSGNYGYLGGVGYGIYGFGTSGNIGVFGTSTGGIAVYGTSTNNIGIYGNSTNSFGAYGRNANSRNFGYLGNSDYGVYGQNFNSGNYGYLGSSNYGVYGCGESYLSTGVMGTSTDGVGVAGYSTNDVAVQGISTNSDGVYGYNPTTGNLGSLGGTYGAYGYSYSGDGVYGSNGSSGNYGYLGASDYGVYGNGNSSNIGVYGTSTGGIAVYGTSTINSGVYGNSISSYGVYGRNDNSGNYGYLGNSNYGVYGQNFNSGNYGYLGGGSYGVYGYNSINGGTGVFGYSSGGSNGVYGYNSTNGTGVFGYSSSGTGVFGQSSSGYAGYFDGYVYVTGVMSAGTVIDRTPYPKDLATAYQAVMSMERLPDGQYQENNKENQLDHSKLSSFIRSTDGNRDLSATVSALNEVVKDLIKKVEAQKQLIEVQNAQIQQLVKTSQTNNNLKSLSRGEE